LAQSFYKKPTLLSESFNTLRAGIRYIRT